MKKFNQLHAYNSMCPTKLAFNCKKQAFTLVELSIALVIIALIAGAIVAGNELIRTAETRNYLSQLDRYRIAIKTFQSKYDALPGDMSANKAAKNGFPAKSYGGLCNGDGLITSSFGFGGGGEILQFWPDLWFSGLVTGVVPAGDTCNNNSGGQTVSNYFPLSSLGKSYDVVYGDPTTGINYFVQLSTSVQTVSTYYTNFNYGDPSAGYSLTPLQAYAVDSKIDDGAARTGSVTARQKNNATDSLPMPLATLGGPCVSSSTSTYDVSGSAGTTPACFVHIPVDSPS